MKREDYEMVRVINYHHGRLAAIKWVRTAKRLPFLVARLAVADILNGEPWTNPPVGMARFSNYDNFSY